jgi:flagellar capping protein FliD
MFSELLEGLEARKQQVIRDTETIGDRTAALNRELDRLRSQIHSTDARLEQGVQQLRVKT